MRLNFVTNLVTRILAQPCCELLEPRLDNFVVVLAPGVARDASTRYAIFQLCRLLCKIEHRERNDRLRSWQKCVWMTGYLGTFCRKPG